MTYGITLAAASLFAVAFAFVAVRSVRTSDSPDAPLRRTPEAGVESKTDPSAAVAGPLHEGGVEEQPTEPGGIGIEANQSPARGAGTAAASPSESSVAPAASPLAAQAEVNEIPIDPKTIVGLVCTFSVTATNTENGKSVTLDDNQAKGSGVIVNEDGYILTNRHVIENAAWEQEATLDDGMTIPVRLETTLKYCDVGQVPAHVTLPDAGLIRAINPNFRIPVLAYRAVIAYIPTLASLSPSEHVKADFAFLRIVGLSDDAATFGITAVPNEFPYVDLISVTKLKKGDEVLTYGFPGDVVEGQNLSFGTLVMTGSVGTFQSFETGDRFFGHTPLVVRTSLDVSGGRSGSPLFWRGHVIGIIRARLARDRTQSFSVASDAILRVLSGM